MNKKQIMGLLVAGAVFAFVGAISVLTNTFSNVVSSKNEAKQSLESMITSNEVTLPVEDFIGVVNVEGTIVDSPQSEGLFSNSASYNHKSILNYINSMINAENNRGIILYVNSPGGGVYESDELYLKLEEYKEKTGRPIWTYMGARACSGGYYISMASDKIYANRNTWTGSIGVIISLTNVKGLYDKLGIQEIDIVSGPNKTVGSSGLEMTEEHHAILQGLVDESYERFAGIVAEGRNMDINTVKPIADGRIYNAQQALDLGLIDNIDTYENMQQDMLESVGEYITIYTPESSGNIFASIFSKIEDLQPKSDAQVISEYLKEQNDGGLMYYAKPE